MRPLTLFIILTAIVTPLFFASAGVVTEDLGKTGGAAKFDVAHTDSFTISKIVGTIIRSLLGLLGTVFLVLLVYAGYTWMTAGGNEEEVSKAKKLIAQAIIGLAIVLAAYGITAFVIDALKTSVTGQ